MIAAPIEQSTGSSVAFSMKQSEFETLKLRIRSGSAPHRCIGWNGALLDAELYENYGIFKLQ